MRSQFVAFKNETPVPTRAHNVGENEATRGLTAPSRRRYATSMVEPSDHVTRTGARARKGRKGFLPAVDSTRRHRAINVRLSEEEWEILQLAAQQANTNAHNLVRLLIQSLISE